MNSQKNIGAKVWAIAEGYIPAWSNGPKPEMTSHEALCFLNTCEIDAHIEIMIYFSDCDPIGPFKEIVGARRTKHIRINNLHDPEKIPTGTDFAMTVHSDQPIVVQHTRLDSRQAENSLFSTIAYSAGS